MLQLEILEVMQVLVLTSLRVCSSHGWQWLGVRPGHRRRRVPETQRQGIARILWENNEIIKNHNRDRGREGEGQ